MLIVSECAGDSDSAASMTAQVFTLVASTALVFASVADGDCDCVGDCVGGTIVNCVSDCIGDCVGGSGRLHWWLARTLRRRLRR